MEKLSVRIDKALFTNVVLTHIAALKRFAMSLCRNDFDADDLVSDTVLKAYEKFHSLRNRAKELVDKKGDKKLARRIESLITSL
jgi:DNA-directed RNA polymerase specialized sigma24 family protein